MLKLFSILANIFPISYFIEYQRKLDRLFEPLEIAGICPL